VASKSGGRFSDKAARQFNESSGRRGEAWAALFLQLKLYRIIGRRVKTPVGEIDLIARRGHQIAFIEVKSRSFSSGEADALAAVNIRRIVRASEVWLTRHPRYATHDMRYDVIFLAPFAWPRHITAAFDATGL
jgi:putative endonuclease